MNITEYNRDLTNNTITSFLNVVPRINESSFVKYNYHNDSMEYNNNIHITNYSGSDSQQLAMILQQFMSDMGDNETIYNILSSLDIFNSESSVMPTSIFSFETFFPSSTSNTNSYHFLSFLSLWFVLIVNPIVILFGVTGNLLATYILIHCNIAKLPVSFYTIMLNISDTLNLLIPVFIFWLDNCINRIPERGYFRDRSNFLCKALMCPDQLFASLSAWYMCAISFNRWYSVCRPSSYFFRTTTTTTNNRNSIKHGQKKNSSSSSATQSNALVIPFCFPINCCSCLTRNIKFRQHLQAFRSIAFMTLMGILCCLYPIFMHELRPFISTNRHTFDVNHKMTNPHPTVWKRCYYSQKHEYAYDAIGIILSCFLHLLPLTFVAAMNIMIIIRLKQRQYRMTMATNSLPSRKLSKKTKSFNSLQKKNSYLFNSSSSKNRNNHRRSQTGLQPTLITNRKDQATSTDLSIQTFCVSNQPSTKSNNARTTRRHHSRDRTITIMLVSVALSYLVLTLPYRLFWLYFVYIKRVYPTKLSSSVYLLKMHYIDHVLRTIRNIHYGTNFVFFIFLSKTFRRKFRQIFVEKFFQTTNRLFHRNSTTINTNYVIYSKNNRQRQMDLKLEKKRNTKTINIDPIIGIESLSRSIFDETPSLIGDVRMQEDEIVPIIELEHNNLSRYDDES
ncbi:unnamed protein product [Rotaria sp. Silwood2]|nr:unnamed protein product [Rotaria sp. Silwood2]CAF2601765.1 unnamed protein product [Rotaria sp. Silwood2]CAF2819790.1 unnamed protein product [Rotaria sp. Silwood2]CAF2980748.1 unnamed protein product [Rotaria sp. Silwood2]CAF3977256.1 unnamed protein product [Rotaria sp. Silwood2]